MPRRIHVVKVIDIIRRLRQSQPIWEIQRELGAHRTVVRDLRETQANTSNTSNTWPCTKSHSRKSLQHSNKNQSTTCFVDYGRMWQF